MQSSQDAQHAEMIAFPLLIIVLLVIYRALAPTFLTLTVAGISLAATQGVGDLLARVFDISNMYITGASLIGLAVSVDYCLFVLKRYEEKVNNGDVPSAAIVAANRSAGHAVRFGGTAVIAALCTLFIPRNMVFTSIATAGIIVTLIAIALTSTLLPAAVSVLGKRMFWGRLPGFAQNAATPSSSRTVKAALRTPGAIAAVMSVLFLALALPLTSLALRVPVASASILPEKTDSRVGIETMKAGLDSRTLFPTSVTIVGDSLDQVLDSTSRVQAIAEKQPSVAHTASAASSPRTMAEARRSVTATGNYATGGTGVLARYQGGYASRVVVIAQGAPDSSSAHELTHALRSATTKTPGTVYVTGATAQGDDFDGLVERSIPWILVSVAIVSVVLLGLAFRSAWLPVIAIALNALVVGAAMGTLTFAWKAVTGADINSVTPIVLFAIVFGLSMDYMVLMANRMKEEYGRVGEHAAAITSGSQRTSRLVTSAAIIMMAVFLSFFVAKISIVRELGTGLAIAVFFDAFLVRTLLMPAVLAALGERVWGRKSGETSPEPATTPAGAS